MNIPADLEHTEVLAEDVRKGDFLWLHECVAVKQPVRVTQVLDRVKGKVTFVCRNDEENQQVTTCGTRGEPMTRIIQ